MSELKKPELKKVLVTAFEPFGAWKENASWLVLKELTKDLPISLQVTTRLYPVDFKQVRQRLEKDLQTEYEVVLHLGQAEGASSITFEQIGVNVAQGLGEASEASGLLVSSGPVAYRSDLPLADWVRLLRREEIPAKVSYHAGTFLCNASLYWSHYLTQQLSQTTKIGFIHVPLALTQVVDLSQDRASLSVQRSARAIRIVLEQIAAL